MAPDLRGSGGLGRRSGEGYWRPLIPALMRSPVVVIGRVFRQDVAQVRLVDDEHPVQALRADGADGALRDGVAFGVWGGVFTTVRPSLAKTVSKLAGNLPSRSRIRKRKV